MSEWSYLLLFLGEPKKSSEIPGGRDSLQNRDISVFKGKSRFRELLKPTSQIQLMKNMVLLISHRLTTETMKATVKNCGR